MGEGIEKARKRRAYERNSHVNNIHLEYANSAYNAQSEHILRARARFECETKGATGQWRELKSMRVHTVC